MSLSFAPAHPWSLHRNPLGQLIFVREGAAPIEITPVRAFALSAPTECLSFVSATGEEVLWLESLSQAPAAAQALIQQELAQRDFVPQILAITGLDSYATPSTWQIETDRGATQLVLKAEEDIRRLPDHALLIADGQGVQYVIRDRRTLDAHSRRILKRFL
ncbi:DUF1854 domain-containing protein [Parvibium lacunae]|uniref:DUF1854 domain-containing protein n=1 Tax=Parvibium lacunae TaxID=1888893 RepID=A0A368L6T8_9BURK|nr:DUF1854 domain-containing protein [Parvibium lacunae]RCS59221.1 DUF1854 domain-containing protein [Parvibium lacunae]